MTSDPAARWLGCRHREGTLALSRLASLSCLFSSKLSSARSAQLYCRLVPLHFGAELLIPKCLGCIIADPQVLSPNHASASWSSESIASRNGNANVKIGMLERDAFTFAAHPTPLLSRVRRFYFFTAPRVSVLHSALSLCQKLSVAAFVMPLLKPPP
jgi:hypothetical protein